MDLCFHAVNVIGPDGLTCGDFEVENSRIARVPESGIWDPSRYFLFPGFTDVHVHLREPGFSYKETIAAGSRAGARGGYTGLCAMPNLNPVPDCLENLQSELDLIRRDAVIRVAPYGAITQGEKGLQLAQFKELAPYVAAFSDDGRGVQNPQIMLQAMRLAKSLHKIIAAHCEDDTLVRSGIIHDGSYARMHGLRGICSQSEWGPIQRDLGLAEQTGCSYHICHVSCRESVDLIRAAKARGVDVTCETAPHYLILDDMQLQNSGAFRMNPPIRSVADRQALIEGILDGTIDMIATDHAPHSEEEKSGGLTDSLNGIVGLETAFPMLYTELVRPGIISLEHLIRLLHDNPSRRFGLGTPLAVGAPASFTLFDLSHPYLIDPQQFLSKGRSTPFAGREVYGRCLLTVYCGRVVWCDPSFQEALLCNRKTLS